MYHFSIRIETLADGRFAGYISKTLFGPTGSLIKSGLVCWPSNSRSHVMKVTHRRYRKTIVFDRLQHVGSSVGIG